MQSRMETSVFHSKVNRRNNLDFFRRRVAQGLLNGAGGGSKPALFRELVIRSGVNVALCECG
jgi:hypothetical protein